jgi:hypothetical protein
MSKPMVKEHNLTTGEIIEREMTDDEFELYQEEAAKEAEKLLVSQERATKRAELLERLGLTEEEAKLLFS